MSVRAELGEWRWWCHLCSSEKLVPSWSGAMLYAERHWHRPERIAAIAQASPWLAGIVVGDDA